MDTETEVRNIGVLIFPEAQVLDVTGPHEVFSSARHFMETSPSSIGYHVFLISGSRQPIRVSSGMEIVPDYDFHSCPSPLDTLIVPGTENIEQILKDSALLDWIGVQSVKVRRLVSICTGAFLLAHLGLLDGKSITTHWAYCEDLRRLFPQLKIDSDSIFIKEGNVYTSAGVTAGIDLSLALLEEDVGKKLAMRVARKLVVFYRRPGGQKQFSDILMSQSESHFGALIDWMIENLSEDLSIETLAQRARMSPRNFTRKFKDELGETPGKFIERLRVGRAQILMENQDVALKTVARKSGFNTEEQMRRAFQRSLSITPNEYRARF